MAKKQKKIETKRTPTKRQLSKWQRQDRTRRIIIIAASIFIVGIVGYVGFEQYNKEIKPLHEVVIEVNDASFNMEYYVKMLEAQTKGMEPNQIVYWADLVASQIEQGELIRQGANSMGIEVTTEEIDNTIKEKELPDSKVYKDVIAATLLSDKLREHFESQLPGKMEQANIQVMLVESQRVADNVTAAIRSGGNFTALANDFSCNSEIQGALGWVPRELMPNDSIGDAAFSLEPGEVSEPIYDSSATKDIGYWLIEVTDKNEEHGIKARALLLGSEEEADKVKAQLASSGNFTSLAEEYSQHQANNGEGGELGWLQRGDMGSDAFDEVAFNLDLNVISEPVQDKTVQTKGVYWIVEVLEKGAHELSEEVKAGLAYNDFSEWLTAQREKSIIRNYLDEEKKFWAVDRVLKER